MAIHLIFSSIFKFIERMESKAVNKKSLEGLVYGGGFDDFGLKRAQYLAIDSRNTPFLDHWDRQTVTN